MEKLVERYNQKSVGQTLRPPGLQTGKRSARHTKVAAHLDFEIGSANVRVLAKKKKISIETAAREARYIFFAQIARRRRCHTIFLAHHADDLVETFLINLFRGAGSLGLAAIREVSTRRIDKVEVTIVRPFLHLWREDINNYVREHGLRFREDPTNKNLDPLRNRIRHQIIPYLEKNLSRNIRVTIGAPQPPPPKRSTGWKNDVLPLQQVDVAALTNNCGDLLVEKLRRVASCFSAADFEMAALAKHRWRWIRRDRARASLADRDVTAKPTHHNIVTCGGVLENLC